MQHSKRLPSGEYIFILILRTIGNFLIFSSLFIIAKTFYQPIAAEIRYFADKRMNKEYVVGSTAGEAVIKRDFSVGAAKGSLAKAAAEKKVEVLVPVDPEYSIVIPKIAANARVLSNINPVDENEYLTALQSGVAHAAGTAFPGENGHIFLFAHSTDYIWNVGSYNAVFYLLYKLEAGDEINIFYKGKRHVYSVTGKQLVDPTQVEYLTRKTNKEFITLQTCWPPGTTLKRMLVFAEPKVK